LEGQRRFEDACYAVFFISLTFVDVRW